MTDCVSVLNLIVAIQTDDTENEFRKALAKKANEELNDTLKRFRAGETELNETRKRCREGEGELETMRKQLTLINGETQAKSKEMDAMEKAHEDEMDKMKQTAQKKLDRVINDAKHDQTTNIEKVKAEKEKAIVELETQFAKKMAAQLFEKDEENVKLKGELAAANASLITEQSNCTKYSRDIMLETDKRKVLQDEKDVLEKKITTLTTETEKIKKSNAFKQTTLEKSLNTATSEIASLKTQVHAYFSKALLHENLLSIHKRLLETQTDYDEKMKHDPMFVGIEWPRTDIA